MRITIALFLFASVSMADPFSGDLFYTRFSGSPNVKKVTATFDGATFTLGATSSIGTTTGADGISGNPQNSDLLLVGGQGGRINTISKSTGTATVYASPVSVFHLEVSDPTTVYGSGIPGFLAKHTINPDGSLTAGTMITLSGHDTRITQLITTPSGFFYTTSGSGGFGTFGTLTFTGATTATTTRLHGPGGSVGGAVLAAAHGGVYDPLTGTIIIVGDDHITQLDLLGNIISNRSFLGFAGINPNFDQGTVDGAGHLFAASNSGHLLMMDYGASGLIGDLTNPTSLMWLDSNLDDIAPLVGSGSTDPDPIPEPATLVLFGVVTVGAYVRRRRREAS